MQEQQEAQAQQPSHPCTFNDLEANVPRWDSYSVDQDGNALQLVYEGDSYPGDNVDEYECVNCGLRFMPDGHSAGALELAWQDVLAHLQNQPTTASSHQPFNGARNV